MAKWEGLEERFRQRLRDCGYWKDGRADVMRFAVERQYPVSYVYKWLHGACPEPETLKRLAKDLGVSASWLLLGEGVARPIAGGSVDDGPLLADYVLEIMPLIGELARRVIDTFWRIFPSGVPHLQVVRYA